MSESAADKKRLIRVTDGNVRNGSFPIAAIRDFLPSDIVGSPGKSGAARGNPITIWLDGMLTPIESDVAADRKTGRARSILRVRGPFRAYYQHRGVRDGDLLAMERLTGRAYRVTLCDDAAAQFTPTRRRAPRAAANSMSNGKPHGTLQRKPAPKARTFAEFFAGIGLVRLALERQGWKALFANDIDPLKAKMYRDNWPNDDHLAVGDIHNLRAADIPTCDLFTASFPCNDLSIAGRWEGLNGRESSSFWGFIRILRELGDRKPPLVLLENVLGFLMSRGGRDFEQALLALNELGYAVDALVLNAACWTPQSRARLFVLGRSGGAPNRRAVAIESPARPDALCVFVNTHPHICWDIRPLPPVAKTQKRLEDIVQDLPHDDPHWWSRERAEYFMSQLSPKHEAEAQRMIDRRTYSYATAFRRVRNQRSMAELRTDGIAGCLRTPRGGSGRQILFKAGRGRFAVRLLTARECARLQGVPDSYLIRVPLNQALFGFGDAVCVPAVEWIANHCLSFPGKSPITCQKHDAVI